MRGRKEETLQHNPRTQPHTSPSSAGFIACLLYNFNHIGNTIHARASNHTSWLYKQIKHLNHVTFMTFQHNSFTLLLHFCLFFHILFRSMIALQMKWLMIKGLTRTWTPLLHSCRTSVVWLTDWLAGWQQDCGKSWTGLLWGEAGKNLSCLLHWHGNTQEERGIKGKKEKKKRHQECERDRNPALCTMWKNLCIYVFWFQQYACLCHLLFPLCYVPVARCFAFKCASTYLELCSLVRSWFLAESIYTLHGLTYDCPGRSYPHSSSICCSPSEMLKHFLAPHTVSPSLFFWRPT